MPTIARLCELVNTALVGLPVTVEIQTEQGVPYIRVQPNPGTVSADEASPGAHSGSEGASFSVVSGSGTATGPAAVDRWWERITPVEPGPQVLSLSEQLRGGGELSGIERIRLAYCRGRQASSIYRGEISYFTGSRSGLKNRCYVVLRSRDYPNPFFTWTFATHQSAVRPPPGDFDPAAISHGFPSQAEARAFCLGAGLLDLHELA